jgi:hypothetical protein
LTIVISIDSSGKAGTRLGPLRLALLAREFRRCPHPVVAVVIAEIAQHPNAGVIHFDDRRNALRRAEPEHGYIRWRRNRIAVKILEICTTGAMSAF